MRSHRSCRPLSISAVAVFVLSSSLGACGASSGSSASPDLPSGKKPPEEFGLSLGDLASRVESMERLIATCMSQDGFQYIALDFASIKKAMDSDQTAVGVPADDFVKQFGLGITTQFDKPLVVFGAGPGNSAYLNGLPAAEQVAFRRALWGEAPDWNHARALEQEDFSETGGCTRAAAEQTYSATELSGTYINPGDKLIEQDPRMIAALKQWGECMRAKGYEYDVPDQVNDDLLERLAAVLQGQDPKALSGPALDALHELQGEELAIAAVYVSCDEDKIQPVQAKIEAELYGVPQP